MIAVGLILGFVLGFASSIFTPKSSVTELRKEISTLQNQLHEKDSQITSLESQIGELKSQISTLKSTINEKNGEISHLTNLLKTKDSQISELQSQIEELEKLIPPLKKGEWNSIINFTGAAEKTTELFYVPSSNWRIKWSYEGGEWAAFSFYVYPEGEDIFYVESITAEGPSKSDETYIYQGPGNFYIRVVAANIEKWRLEIEAYISS